MTGGGEEAGGAVAPAGSGALTAVGAVVFRPVRAGNSLEDTVSRLMQTIRLGVVAPGDALPPERELAARFSVSRDTVREAIRELADAGYLVSRRGRYGGTFVSDPLPAPVEPVAIGAAELDDLLALRDIVESGGVRSAAGRTLADAEVAALRAALADVDAAAEIDYRRQDSRLHLVIAESAGVPSLVPLIADNRARVNELLDAFPLLPRNIEHSNEQHHAIVDAILAGEPDAAATAMREHLAGSAALLRGFLG